MILMIDFCHLYTCSATTKWLKAPAYETIVIELTWVDHFHNHIESSIFYCVFDWDKISFNIFSFGFRYDQRVSDFNLCEDPQKSIFF